MLISSASLPTIKDRFYDSKHKKLDHGLVFQNLWNPKPLSCPTCNEYITDLRLKLFDYWNGCEWGTLSLVCRKWREVKLMRLSIKKQFFAFEHRKFNHTPNLMDPQLRPCRICNEYIANFRLKLFDYWNGYELGSLLRVCRTWRTTTIANESAWAKIARMYRITSPRKSITLQSTSIYHAVNIVFLKTNFSAVRSLSGLSWVPPKVNCRDPQDRETQTLLAISRNSHLIDSEILEQWETDPSALSYVRAAFANPGLEGIGVKRMSDIFLRSCSVIFRDPTIQQAIFEELTRRNPPAIECVTINIPDRDDDSFDGSDDSIDLSSSSKEWRLQLTTASDKRRQKEQAEKAKIKQELAERKAADKKELLRRKTESDKRKAREISFRIEGELNRARYAQEANPVVSISSSSSSISNSPSDRCILQ